MEGGALSLPFIHWSGLVAGSLPIDLLVCSKGYSGLVVPCDKETCNFPKNFDQIGE